MANSTISKSCFMIRKVVTSCFAATNLHPSQSMKILYGGAGQKGGYPQLRDSKNSPSSPHNSNINPHITFRGLKYRQTNVKGYLPILENHMRTEMEDEMESEVIQGLMGIIPNVLVLGSLHNYGIGYPNFRIYVLCRVCENVVWSSGCFPKSRSGLCTPTY